VTATSQTRKEFSGRGRLLRGSRADIAVRYYLLLSTRLSTTCAAGGVWETHWEWDKAEGFLTLLDEVDAFEVDVQAKYTLVLEDGTRCVPALCHDYARPLLKYRIQCSPKDLLSPLCGPALCGRSPSRPPLDAAPQP
jgi:hypothetical protein